VRQMSARDLLTNPKAAVDAILAAVAAIGG
jgi:hypothetical protein